MLKTKKGDHHQQIVESIYYLPRCDPRYDVPAAEKGTMWWLQLASMFHKLALVSK